MGNESMNAVITGATGFLGSALVGKILDSGGRVAALVRKGSPNNSRLPRHANLNLLEGNLDNLEEWYKSLESFPADVFYHLAWKGVGNRYRNDPVQLSNIEPTLATLRLAEQIGCRRWIGTGSQAEYGPLNRRISEQDPLEPTTLYGAAKASACLLARTLGRQVGIETAWVRVFSTYGPGDNNGWMMVDVIRELIAGRRPALTPGEQKWDYLYVDDAVDALYALAIADNVSGVYNLGSGQSRTIRSIVELTRDMIDPELPLGFGEIPYRPDQVMHLEADISRLMEDTGWSPRTNLETGIRDLLQSIRKHDCAEVDKPAG